MVTRGDSREGDRTASSAASPIPLDPRHVDERVDLRVLSAMRRIIRSVDLYSRELASKAKITSPQLVCLLTLVEKGPMTATTISREVFLSPSTIVGILDRLEEKGLVKRQRAREDRRVVKVTVTDEGRQVAEAAPSPLQDTLTEALHKLPESEQVEIAKSLERVVSLMEVQHIDAAPILETGPIVKPNKNEPA
ncbi:MAG: MarR family transcriptional regulator [Betaproteobacteria bacterium]|nr:MAG: MarR family transcriptional regulator [Betaproteobacteria bacterium]